MKRLLILEDGSVYEGTAFGADHFQVGELVFNTNERLSGSCSATLSLLRTDRHDDLSDDRQLRHQP